MIESHLQSETGTGYIIITPNRSLSWRGNRWVVVSLGVLLGFSCLGFSLLGLWLVIPFAGLELAVVWGALYLTTRRAQYQEVVRFTPDEVIVERGRKRPDEKFHFQRAWSRFVLVRPASRLQRLRLVLRSHGREIEIGRRLAEADLEDLLSHLRDAVRSAPHPGAWTDPGRTLGAST
jgi:uncharacterized membrane protein